MADRVALITGIAGGLARMVGSELAERGFEIVGVDYRRPQLNLGYEAIVYQANYNKTKIEDIYRRHRPTHLIHLGRVGNLKEQMGKRFDLNVIGSGKLMDLSLKYGVKRAIVLSTFHIYGAHPHNHTPIYEDEPMRAGLQFPQIADAIQLDTLVSMWIYRHPEVETVVLRPCNVIGPHLQNAISRFLRQATLPRIIGFNPMSQFIHERDMVSAILAAMSGPVGVFNVAGKSPFPWHDALDLTGARQVPVPSSFASLYLRVARAVSSALPPYMVNYTKYPCVISDDTFRAKFGWQPEVNEVDSIRTTVRGLG